MTDTAKVATSIKFDGPHINRPLINRIAAEGKLEITTGEYLNGGKVLPTGYSSVGHKSSHALFRALDRLRVTPPSTPERYALAVMVLQGSGFHVKWEDKTKAPEVTWFDFEGALDGASFPQFIDDLLHKDFTEELATRDKATDVISEKIQNQIASAYKRHPEAKTYLIDSISKLD